MAIDGFCRCVPEAQEKFGTFSHGGDMHCRLCRKVRRSTDSGAGPVPAAMVTTLDHLPGFHVVAVLGPVVEVADGAARGNYPAMVQQQVRTAAGAMGANAVLGLTGSTFAVPAGATGGTAVGMMLLGTAVVVAADAVADGHDRVPAASALAVIPATRAG